MGLLKMEEIIYLEFNDWFGGRDYPEIPNIEDWVGGCGRLGYNSPLLNDEWCKAQKICVKVGPIDMSCNFCITAPRSWVEKNCPECLTNDTYTESFNYSNGQEQWTKTEEYSFDQFRRMPENGEEVAYGRFGWRFLEYKEENFGITWCDEDGNEDDEEK